LAETGARAGCLVRVETRSFFLVMLVVLAVACIVLARGSMLATEEAERATARCEARTWKRALDVPKITLGLDLKYRGKWVIAVADIPRDAPKIDALHWVLSQERDTTCDPSKLCLDNVVVIETWDNVDSYLVNLITKTAWIAGYDVILAPPRTATTW
jgi:hypothetical protein